MQEPYELITYRRTKSLISL